MEEVVLVDPQDNPIGKMEKMQAHIDGALHRALSVFIFNNKGEMLIHQRALEKYHSAGLWTNTCCSHPRPEEAPLAAAHRRLKEEMGMECELEAGFTFLYRSEFENDLIEHELDHVFIGMTNDLPNPNPEEVAAYRYISWDDLQKEIDQDPERFTTWFRICLPKVKSHLIQSV